MPASRGLTFLLLHLSHHQVEAGSDARYISDLITRMLSVGAYLDSSMLSDLRSLFSDGVHKSSAVVALATKVSSRDACMRARLRLHACMQRT